MIIVAINQCLRESCNGVLYSVHVICCADPFNLIDIFEYFTLDFINR
ncbi:MAG: hypothetical protein OFPI_44710 [Osedax symbiont Rs2]|nr:MAG: hypothetical protein OFPI_44710 [Osedax symbiont Rs2]